MKVKKMRAHKKERKNSNRTEVERCGLWIVRPTFMFCFRSIYHFGLMLRCPFAQMQTTESKTLNHIIKHCNRINIIYEESNKNELEMKTKPKMRKSKKKE